MNLGQQDHKLIAAFARYSVAFPHHAREAAGDVAQHEVAGVMAQGVVDQLEAVEIEEQEGHVTLLTARGGTRFSGLRKRSRASAGAWLVSRW